MFRPIDYIWALEEIANYSFNSIATTLALYLALSMRHTVELKLPRWSSEKKSKEEQETEEKNKIKQTKKNQKNQRMTPLDFHINAL